MMLNCISFTGWIYNHLKNQRVVFGVLSCLMIVSFYVSLHLPLYSDELSSKFSPARSYFDNQRTVAFFPQCGVVDFLTPFILRYYHYFDTAIYEGASGPAYIRNMGVGLVVIWALLCWTLLWKELHTKISAWALASVMIAFCTIGTMPFIIVINRPEQIQLIGLTLLSVPLIFSSRIVTCSLATQLLRSVVLIIFSGYIFSEHPRGAFFFPLIMLYMFYILRNTFLRLAAGVAISYGFWICAVDWSLRLQCQNAEIIERLSKDSLMIALATGHFTEYFSYFFLLSLHEPGSSLFISLFVPIKPSTWNMIPTVNSAAATIVSWGIFFGFAMMLLTGFIAFIAGCSQSLRLRRLRRQYLALASIWAIYFASIITRENRHTYEATLIEPLIVIAVLGSFWAARDFITDTFGEADFRLLRNGAYAALVTISFASQLILIGKYFPYVTGYWSKPGFVVEQPLSVSVVGYESRRKLIVEIANLCRIGRNDSIKHLLLDEETYYVLQSYPEPFLTTYIDSRYWGDSVLDYEALLRKLASGGVVAECRNIPSQLLKRAVQRGSLCCVPALL